MQYRAEFPIEFPEKPGKSIGNSTLYCIFPDPGNFSILPVYVDSAGIISSIIG